jgi:hypothetical protein
MAASPTNEAIQAITLSARGYEWRLMQACWSLGFTTIAASIGLGNRRRP